MVTEGVISNLRYQPRFHVGSYTFDFQPSLIDPNKHFWTGGLLSARNSHGTCFYDICSRTILSTTQRSRFINPFSASQLSTTNFSLYNTLKIWHLVMRKWELIKQSKLLKIKSQILSNLFNEKYGLRLGEFKNTTGTERVNEYVAVLFVLLLFGFLVDFSFSCPLC